MHSLNGLAAVVVGVGSRIGSACAIRFARSGARIVAVDPDTESAREVASDINASGGDALACTAAIGAGTDIDRVATMCEQVLGRVDVLMNCSAEMDTISSDGSTSNWESVLRTNLLDPILYTERLMPLLKRSAAASVIYLSSIDGLRGNPNVPAYSISKGGLVTLVRVLAGRHAGDRIRFNCIASGGILQTSTTTAGHRRIADEHMLLQLTPLRRMASPADVASAALFFASSESAYVTGTVLPVDGGRIAVTPGTMLT
jgi:NAD(P)-dependent dehydrogenase (short-subunit alcohol dehydrogenase family)